MADPAYLVDGVLTDGEAWVGIAHASLSLPATQVTWTSTDDGQTGDFSQYMDLVIVTYSRGDGAAVNGTIQLELNGDSGANYAKQIIRGDGADDYAASGTGLNYWDSGEVPCGGASANIFGASVIHLFDINSGKYKSMISNSAADTDGAGYVTLYAATWLSQAAVTEIDLFPRYATNWVAGTVFDLFGVLPRMVAV